jgi:hypothetical protein
MCQQSTGSGMMLVRAGKEAPGRCRARRASLELCGEQVSDLIHAEIVRCVGGGRLRLPHIPLGCGHESLELSFLNVRLFS